MVKKVLSVMLLTVGIILSSQFADLSKASAADVYAYTEGGIEYYVTGRRSMQFGYFSSYVKGVRDGQAVKSLFFTFNKSNGEWVYQIQDHTGGLARAYVLEQGYLSNSSKAQTVYNVTKQNF